MKRGGFRESKRGVSEVLGEVLLVAIVVILASILGVQVMGMWNDANTVAPTASISIEDAPDTYPDHAFVLRHQGGDALDPVSLKIVIRDVERQSVNGTLTATGTGFGGDGLTAYLNDWSTEFTTPATASDRITIAATGSADLFSGKEYEVLVIHEPSGQPVASDTVELN